ncbi:MAG: AEC family transporter [Clostridiales bacterium]|nr:AEC family transporter [Clostridiales bacterium]
MESLYLSATVVFPILLQLALGWFLRVRGLLSGPLTRGLNTLVFHVFLPVMMYMNIYHGGLHAFRLPLALFAVISVSVMFLALFAIIPRLEHSDSRRGVLIQGIGRSNFAVFGYAVASTLCGSDNLGIVALTVALVLPLYGIYSTIALEYYAARQANTVSVRFIITSILRNPLVLGGAIGLLSAIVDLRLPTIIVSTLDAVAQVASPLSLIALGGFLNLRRLSGKRISLLVGVIGKLLIVPLVFLSIAAALGFRGVEFATLLAIFASPAATASFTMTQQLGGDDDLAAGLVSVGAVGALGSVGLFILLFKGCLSF